MVYPPKADDVRDVIVNGEPVAHDGRLLTVNAAQIMQKAEEYRAKASASLR